jgi:hypothetical protein
MADNIDMKFTTDVTINIDDIIYGCGREEAMYFIKNVDKQLADWEFTLDCFRYYFKEVIDGAKEEPDIMEEVKEMIEEQGYILVKK